MRNEFAQHRDDLGMDRWLRFDSLRLAGIEARRAAGTT